MWKYGFWVTLLSFPAPFIVIEWTRMWQSDFYTYLPVLFFLLVSLFFIRWDRNLPSAPSSVTVIREATGRYCVSFVVDVDVAALTSIAWTAGSRPRKCVPGADMSFRLCLFRCVSGSARRAGNPTIAT